MRGRFPSAAIDTLISIADLYSAVDREPAGEHAPAAYMGVDIARQGDDQTAIAVIQGDELVHLEGAHIPDLMRVADRVIEVAKRFGISEKAAHHINLDASGGMGWGPHDYLHRLDWSVRGVDFGANPRNEDEFFNRRAEIWVGVRDWLRGPGSLKRAEPQWIRDLEADLCGCTVEMRPKAGKTVYALEPKLKMKERLGHSPDYGDALALAIAAQDSRPPFSMASMVSQLERGPVETGHPDDEPDDGTPTSPFHNPGYGGVSPSGNPFD